MSPRPADRPAVSQARQAAENWRLVVAVSAVAAALAWWLGRSEAAAAVLTVHAVAQVACWLWLRGRAARLAAQHRGGP